MKRYFVVDDGQDVEELLKLLSERGISVTETSGDVLFPHETTCCAADRAVALDQMEACLDTVSGNSEAKAATLVIRAADGIILDYDQSFMELSGYEKTEMHGQNIMGLVFFLNPEFWNQAFICLEAANEVRDLETRMLRRDGLVAFVSVSLRNEEIGGIPCRVITIRESSSGTTIGESDEQRRFLNASLKDLFSEKMDFSGEDVANLIDFKALQGLMNSFYKISRIGIGINDLNGNVHVATGWQDICTRFHRIHPETLKSCLESDIYLSQELGRGEAFYKCKNGMWDVATPLVIGGRHIANIFLGQFFFEDEVPDYGFFRNQAEAYGFDVEEYLAALERVPRWSRELVQNVMEFYRKLATIIARLSIGTIQISRALAHQKRIAEELCQANLLVENSPVMLFRWRAEEGWPVELVSANITRFGYSREELLSGAVSFSSLVYPDDLERIASEVTAYTAAGIDSFQKEYRIVAKDGAVCWVDDRTIVERDAAGTVTHYQGIVIDITERKLTEQELMLSKYCLDNAGISIFQTFEQQIFNANEHACRSLGYSVDELRSMRVSDIDPFIADEKMHEIKRSLETTGSVTHQTIHRRKNGTTYPVEITTNHFEFQGKCYGISFVKDISERMQADEALRLSEDRLRSIFRVAPIGIGVVRYRVLQEVNCRLCDMIGYTQEELVGQNARMLYLDQDEFEQVGREKYQQIAANGTGTIETRWQRKDGSVIDILLASTPMDLADLSKGVIFTALDITERKRSEELLRASLAEKVVLLQEVHHRVKNNLQIISSLLDLQLDSIPDEESRRFIRESRNRITSMALVHEKLYQSENFASIKFANYVQSLSGHLLHTLMNDPNLIAITVDIGDFSLAVDEAIPCGLIINELVSNSLKHAFPPGSAGTITIRCHVGADGRVTLMVADTGLGMPPDLDFRKTESLGLQLVTLLVTQLRGELELSSVGGTSWEITFRPRG